MSKKRKKSRFTKTDVDKICELQRKIDAYECYIMGLCGMIQKRGRSQFVILECGTEMDEWVDMAIRTYMEQIKELPKKEMLHG